MAEADDSGDHIAKEKDKYRYEKELRLRRVKDKKTGKITSIKKSEVKTGGIITPRFSDIHVHLDKTGTSRRIKQRATSLFEAIDLMNEDKIIWSEEDIYQRANHAVNCAWKHGTGLIRTHVDWEQTSVPLAWEVLKTLQSEWKDRVQIEMASLSPLDMLISDGEKIAKIIIAIEKVLLKFLNGVWLKSTSISPNLNLFDISIISYLDNIKIYK